MTRVIDVWARLVPRRTVSILVGVALELILALSVDGTQPGRWAGVNGALGAGIAVVAGLVGGGRAGLVTGLAGGALFVTSGHNGTGNLAYDGVPVIVLWTMLGSTAGWATRRLRARALVERDRLAAIQRITERLSASLSEDEIAQAVVDIAVPAIGADGGVVYVTTSDGSALRMAAQQGYPEGMLDDWREVTFDAIAPVPDAIRAGRTLMLPAQELRRRYPYVVEALRRSGEVGSVAAPLIAGGRAVGGVHFAFMRPVTYGPDLEALVNGIAGQCAASLERAKLYERTRETSVTLQRSLLPGTLPDVPWLDVASFYRPQAGSSEVGGDFYDVVRLSDDAVFAFIGDVSGKGVPAAAVTSQARYTLRALAPLLASPAAILSELNAVLLGSEVASGLFCTVAAVRVDRDRDGSVRVTVALAGHPPPLIVHAEGSVEEAGRTGQLIGVLEEVVIRDRILALEPGDRLLLYTDGITEARREGEMLGEERLVQMLQSAGSASPAELVVRVAEIADRHADASQDDAALLCIGVPRG